MNKPKMIQIPLKMFFDIYTLVHELEDEILDQELLKTIKTHIDDKIDAMVRHSLYTTSKTALTDEEREAARKKYLDEIGMPSSFRW